MQSVKINTFLSLIITPLIHGLKNKLILLSGAYDPD